MTHQGLLLTDTEWAQLPELFGYNYLKELKGKLLWLAGDCKTALWNMHTVESTESLDTQQTNATNQKQKQRITSGETLSYILTRFLTGVNIESNLDVCTLPAGVSAHTENVHFLKTSEGHFYLKKINIAIRKWNINVFLLHVFGAKCRYSMCNDPYDCLYHFITASARKQYYSLWVTAYYAVLSE